MSIVSGDLLKINGTTIPGLREYKVSYNKLFKDAERNMNGDVRASMIGVFPKIELVFRDALTVAQVKTIIGLVSNPYFNVTFYEPSSDETVTARYYANDPTVEVLDRSRGLYKSFGVNLIPVSKMSIGGGGGGGDDDDDDGDQTGTYDNTAAYLNSHYRGKDLTGSYTISELSTKVSGGDFTGLRLGDYITLNTRVSTDTQARDMNFYIAGADYFYQMGDSQLNKHHLVMIPDGFYTYAKMNDTNTTTGGYHGSKMHGICSATYTAGSGGALTSVLADYTLFRESDLGENDGTYVFVYSSSASSWQYNGTNINRTTYGLTYTGSPVDGDTITVTYVIGYLEPYRKAIYDAFGNSHIVKFRDFQSTSTSAGRWCTARVELMNECMVYGTRIYANNVNDERFKPSMLPLFATNPQIRLGHRGKGGSRYTAWLSSIAGGSGFCIVYTGGVAYAGSASVSGVVRPYFLFA